MIGDQRGAIRVARSDATDQLGRVAQLAAEHSVREQHVARVDHRPPDQPCVVVRGTLTSIFRG